MFWNCNKYRLFQCRLSCFKNVYLIIIIQVYHGFELNNFFYKTKSKLHMYRYQRLDKSCWSYSNRGWSTLLCHLLSIVSCGVGVRTPARSWFLVRNDHCHVEAQTFRSNFSNHIPLLYIWEEINIKKTQKTCN